MQTGCRQRIPERDALFDLLHAVRGAQQRQRRSAQNSEAERPRPTLDVAGLGIVLDLLDVVHHQVHELVIALQHANHCGQMRRLHTRQRTLAPASKLDAHSLVDVLAEVQDRLLLRLFLPLLVSTTARAAPAPTSTRVSLSLTVSTIPTRRWLTRSAITLQAQSVAA